MGDYKYDDLTTMGYTRFYLSKNQHNSLFFYRQIRWYDKYEYYFNDKEIVMHCYYNILGKIINTLLFPIYVILYGFYAALISMYSIWKQKEHGAYLSDNFGRGNKKYVMIMRMIKLNKLR